MAKPEGRKTGARSSKGRQRAKGGPPHPPKVARNARSGEIRPREELVAATLAKGKSKAEALRAGGFHPESRTIRAKLGPDGAIGARVIEIMDQEGATLHAAARATADGLEGKETKFFPTLGRRNKKTGKVHIPEREIVAHEPRLKAADMVYRLHGAYPRPEDADDQRKGGPVVAIQFNIVSKDQLGGNGKGRILDNIEFRTVTRKP